MAGNGKGYKQAVSCDSHCHEGKADACRLGFISWMKAQTPNEYTTSFMRSAWGGLGLAFPANTRLV
jgi:hypothetical protein